MSLKVAALYQFVPLPDFRALRDPLRARLSDLGVKGTLLLASEGVNGTLAGTPESIDACIDELRHGALFAGRLDNLELKFSTAATMPFGRLKIRLKKEIVTLGDPGTDPAARVGTYVDARDWNALIKQDDVLVLDTRNAFEVALGTFDGAVDPKLSKFSDFRTFTERRLDPAKDRKIAMFCTGGIRCEKASAFLLARGFGEVFHLKGGILKYLEDIPEDASLWRGECFVFDDRVALGHGLAQRASQGKDAAQDGSQAAMQEALAPGRRRS
jgi:UPF0176 protein